MSPFDMFVLTVFIIVSIKGIMDSIAFWNESEELAKIHFKVQAAASNNRASALRTNQVKMNPKHLPPPVRPARMPVHTISNSCINKPRAKSTGLKVRRTCTPVKTAA